LTEGKDHPYLLPWIAFHFVPARAVKGVQPPHVMLPEDSIYRNEALNRKDELNALRDIDLNMIEKPP
jgi:hypothetical protein